MTVLKGIDISNWQAGFDISAARPGFVIAKATQGTTYVDRYCDGFIQDCIKLGIPFGFYHFARSNDAAAEAKFFYENTRGYIGKGIPVLDFEVANSNDWLETWCKTYHDLSGIYPWVYMSSDYINNRGYGTDWVKANCGLWLAGYPKAYTSYPNVDCPYAHTGWTLAAWQFTSSLAMGGMSIDGDYFYGDRKAWNAYAGISGDSGSNGVGNGLESHSTLDLASAVIKGSYGVGANRRKALGSRYDEVQAKVNDIYAKANAVIKGNYGNGAARKQKLGAEYDIVQFVVNDILK
jgi:GH25 family lysozyme M1 (1,4-beta-N-acetylmuramidase)